MGNPEQVKNTPKDVQKDAMGTQPIVKKDDKNGSDTSKGTGTGSCSDKSSSSCGTK